MTDTGLDDTAATADAVALDETAADPAAPISTPVRVKVTAEFIGARIGHYRITKELGRGGMGVVCLAVHEQVGQRAAVKILLPEQTGNPQYAQRFVNEARAACRVHHPGLVKLFDFGTTPDGAPYILMEFLEGELLRARLLRQRAAGKKGLPPTEALRITRQLAQALSALHEEGIVHRDLKPENVMLVKDVEAAEGERAKVLDFGIAKLTQGGQGLTQDGVLVGTARYMSPEQCAGDAVLDGKSDVYALGVMLCELLVGSTPFSGPSAQMLRQHILDPPPTLKTLLAADFERAAALPLFAEAEQLTSRMLRKLPAERPSMLEIADEIRRLSGAPAGASGEAPKVEPLAAPAAIAVAVAVAVPAPSPSPVIEKPRRSLRFVAPLGIAVLLVAIGVGLVVLRASKPQRPAMAMAGMVWLPGGTFNMGSTPQQIESECARLGASCVRTVLDREAPSRRITVSPFFLDRYEVTNQEFAAFLNDRMFWEVREDVEHKLQRFVYDQQKGTLLVDLWPDFTGLSRASSDRFVSRPGQEKWPVTMVTWEAASMYCRAQGKRLPTEAEWEFAARGKTQRRYPWGDEEPRCDGVNFGRSADMPCKDSKSGLQDVGSAQQDKTPEGIFDLGGNVSEWVQDQYLLPYYPPCGKCVDPKVENATTNVAAGSSPADDTRVFRGGASPAPADVSRAATRRSLGRTQVFYGLGFRCASG